jgi:hypothetical protein
MRPGNHLAKADANPYNLLANLVFLEIGRRLRKARRLVKKRPVGVQGHSHSHPSHAPEHQARITSCMIRAASCDR